MLKMKMITKAILKKLPKLYSTENIPVEKKNVICKYFSPVGNWTWYVIEGEEQKNGDILFWGYVKGHENEYGFFSLNQLNKIRLPYGLKIERDLHFGNVPLIDILEGRNY